MQKWLTYGQNFDFQPRGRRHLGFCRISILLVKPVTGRQIWCESIQKWPSYGHLTDFKMAAAAILNLLLVTILSFGPLGVVAGDVSVKFRNCSSIYG